MNPGAGHIRRRFEVEGSAVTLLRVPWQEQTLTAGRV